MEMSNVYVILIEEASSAAMLDELCTREEPPLAETHAQRVHACTFPLFEIRKGGQRRVLQPICPHFHKQCETLRR